MQWNILLQQINKIHATTFELGTRYATGEQGAFAVTDHMGRKAVLKWRPGTHSLRRCQQAKAVTDLLRSISYPAPCYLCIGNALGGTYSLQLALPGSPPSVITSASLPRLLELNALQIGCALPELPDWHDEVVNTVLFGGDGYCLHTSLQQHSSETADLLRSLQTLVSTYRDAPHRVRDIVHGDFHNTNILVHDGQVSGVIDWDAPFAGDCSFDVATLLFYSYDVPEMREILWQYILERASPKLLSVYLAHLILRQVDWSLRHHDQATIDCYLSRAHAILSSFSFAQQ